MNIMSSNCKDEGGGHLLLLPYMAHGHLTPFLSLAKKLQERTRFTVTIASTPLNIQYIRSAGAGDSPEIRLAELPFRSADHGLPPDTENNEKVPHEQIMRFLQAIKCHKGPMERLVEEITEIQGRPPVALIFDVLLGWVMDVGNKFGIKSIAFTTGGAYGSLAYNSLWVNLPHRSTDSEEFEVAGFPKHIRFQRSQLHGFIRNMDPKDPWCKFYQPQICAPLAAHAWLVNTVQELEPLGLQLLHTYLKLPVWPVGPLLPISFLHEKSLTSSLETSSAAEWLSQYRPDSVLYIAFGSQNTISASQMMALAMGLEASRKPFIWVIRPPVGSDCLPQGFEHRMNQTKQGLLIRRWAAQLEILSHKSVGAFLSHGGWNSVIESLSQGVPIIGWPIAAEQSYNVKFLVELGVCFELTRWADTAIDWKEIKRVVEMVMDNTSVGTKGEEMKRIAVNLGEKIRAASIQDHSNHGRGHKASSMDDLETFIFSN